METLEATPEVCESLIFDARNRLMLAYLAREDGVSGAYERLEVERWRVNLMESEMGRPCLPVLTELRASGQQIYLLDLDD